jgi:hypothetical protein
MKVEHLAYLGIGLTCLFFLATCDGCDNSENQSYEYSSQDSEDYSWLNGTWVCNTQYGTIIVEISGNHIRENLGGDVYSGTYSIHDNAIHPNTNSHTYYPLDISSQRIGNGNGGYFRKQ